MSSPRLAKIMALNDPIESVIQQKGGIKRKVSTKSMPLPQKRTNRSKVVEKEEAVPQTRGFNTRSKKKSATGFQLPDEKPLDAQELKRIQSDLKRGWEPPQRKTELATIQSKSIFKVQEAQAVQKKDYSKISLPVWHTPLLKKSLHKENEPKANESTPISKKEDKISQLMGPKVCTITNEDDIEQDSEDTEPRVNESTPISKKEDKISQLMGSKVCTITNKEDDIKQDSEDTEPRVNESPPISKKEDKISQLMGSKVCTITNKEDDIEQDSEDTKPRVNESSPIISQGKKENKISQLIVSQACIITNKEDDTEQESKEITDERLQEDHKLSSDERNAVDELNFSPIIEDFSIVKSGITQAAQECQGEPAIDNEPLPSYQSLGGPEESLPKEINLSQDMFANEEEQETDYYPPMKKTKSEMNSHLDQESSQSLFTPPNKINFDAVMCSLPTVKRVLSNLLVSNLGEKETSEEAEVINEEIYLENGEVNKGVVYGAYNLEELDADTYFSPAELPSVVGSKIRMESKEEKDKGGEEMNEESKNEEKKADVSGKDAPAIDNESVDEDDVPLNLSLAKVNVIKEHCKGGESSDFFKTSGEKSQGTPMKLVNTEVNEVSYNDQSQKICDKDVPLQVSGEIERDKLISQISSQKLDFIKPPFSQENKHVQKDLERIISQTSKKSEEQNNTVGKILDDEKTDENEGGENIVLPSHDESGSKEFANENEIVKEAKDAKIGDGEICLLTATDVNVIENILNHPDEPKFTQNQDENQNEKETKSGLGKDRKENMKPFMFEDQDFDISATQLIQIEDEFKNEMTVVFSKPTDSKTMNVSSGMNRNAVNLNNRQNVKQHHPAEASIAPVLINASASCGDAREPPVIPPLPQINWTKKVQEDRLKLKAAIEEITQLNAMLTQVRREVWPQQNRAPLGNPPSSTIISRQGNVHGRRY